IERRRLVAGLGNSGVTVGFLMREPALVVVLAELVGEAVESRTVGPDNVKRNNLVWIGPILAVGPMTLRAGLTKDNFTLGSQAAVDRERVLRRLDREDIGANVGEGGLGLVEGRRRIERAHHELHDRPHR